MPDFNDLTFNENIHLFDDEVWPNISHFFPEATIHTIEQRRDNNVEDNPMLLLDRIAGVDALMYFRNNVYGLALRIQTGIAWETFTVRYKKNNGLPGELEKRNKAMASPGAIYPYITIQAYLDEQENFLSAAAIKTQDLMENITILGKERNADNASFLWVKWDTLRDAGIGTKICRK